MPGLSWILNLGYVALLLAVSPLLLYRMIVLKKYRDGWSQKFLGRLPERNSSRTCLWLHAVSVGEVLQLQTILNALAKARPNWEFVITTTTHTGFAVAQTKFPQHLVCYFPLDFSWSVRRAIRRIRPDAIVLVELELWPNFILEAARQDIPLALTNGRISEHSFGGYRRIRPLMKRLLGCFRLLAVQNETFADRLVALGAPGDRIQVTGSIKFDHVETNRENPKTRELRRSFGIEKRDRVFVAGSTQAPEEEYALDVYEALNAQYPDLRLILVPRHQERFDEVARQVERRQLPLLRRSRLPASTGPVDIPKETDHHAAVNGRGTINPRPVLLLDTLGELAACWGLAEIAFVGGSLTNRGGQNMIEPAAYGAAVLFGPQTHNFRDVVEILLGGHAARVVADRQDLIETVRHFLARPGDVRNQGRIAQRLVLSEQGATDKTVKFILELAEEFDATENRRLHRAA